LNDYQEAPPDVTSGEPHPNESAARPDHPSAVPRTVELLAADCEVDVNQTPDTLTAAQLRTRAAGVDGLLVFMPDLIDADLLDACPRLR